ncbi:preprotein translocase subunit SecE [Candidatus Persebacteraceae bacterium Df01]|jgi:preprotein translocase subunit SecE|uniref:Protein translocase subunit SecE n=1 Tax=Candidatus Doriopsillibacter californiensis TaxID=2970740 RepID=A0ABT7QN51_9GAMM|nr:preprotein translocase subunit SecE [Candidatus Persebacteraceae bacterium Df01]
MTSAEKIKLWASAVLVIGSVYVAGYEISSGQAAARVGVLTVGLMLAATLVGFSDSGKAFFAFARSAGVEVRKVIWPSRQETVRTTGVVVMLVSLVMLFLWVVDFILSKMLDILAR